MSEIITVENLSKKYLIWHEGPAQSETLKEAVINRATSIVRNAASSFRHGMALKADTKKENFWALKDINFEIKQGDKVGIIGRNGAGKSTLLKILSKITTPTTGIVQLKGRVASLLEVGTGFHPELTGRENVYLNGAILGMTRVEIKQKFDEIVDFSGVEKFLDTPVKRYSSGMQVRLAFAVAAHLEPEILLVDEVLAVGDYEFQKKCLNRMETASQEGRTILFVSHNLSAINRLCERAILLDAGEIVTDGVAEKVVEKYLDYDIVGGGGVREWHEDDAPSGHGLKLLSIKSLKEDGYPANTVEVGDKLAIEIKYLTEKANISLRCGILFHTQGVCAFTSMEPFETVRTQAGKYSSTVIIPPNLLTEGEYIIELSILTFKEAHTRYVLIKEAISFIVFDPIKGDSARGDYTKKLSGVVRPLLEWENRYLDANRIEQ